MPIVNISINWHGSALPLHMQVLWRKKKTCWNKKNMHVKYLYKNNNNKEIKMHETSWEQKAVTIAFLSW